LIEEISSEFHRFRSVALRDAKSPFLLWAAALQRNQTLAVEGRTSAPGHDRAIENFSNSGRWQYAMSGQ